MVAEPQNIESAGGGNVEVKKAKVSWFEIPWSAWSPCKTARRGRRVFDAQRRNRLCGDGLKFKNLWKYNQYEKADVCEALI